MASNRFVMALAWAACNRARRLLSGKKTDYARLASLEAKDAMDRIEYLVGQGNHERGRKAIKRALGDRVPAKRRK